MIQTQTQTQATVLVERSIPCAYNPGEYRLSRLVQGPRGGLHWETLYSLPATGGTLQVHLEPGMYKETWWTNGWPTARQFMVVVEQQEEEEARHG